MRRRVRLVAPATGWKFVAWRILSVRRWGIVLMRYEPDADWSRKAGR